MYFARAHGTAHNRAIAGIGVLETVTSTDRRHTQEVEHM